MDLRYLLSAWLVVALMLGTGCQGTTEDFDFDGDGVDQDCNDRDNDIYPGNGC